MLSNLANAESFSTISHSKKTSEGESTSLSSNTDQPDRIIAHNDSLAARYQEFCSECPYLINHFETEIEAKQVSIAMIYELGKFCNELEANIQSLKDPQYPIEPTEKNSLIATLKSLLAQSEKLCQDCAKDNIYVLNELKKSVIDTTKLKELADTIEPLEKTTYNSWVRRAKQEPEQVLTDLALLEKKLSDDDSSIKLLFSQMEDLKRDYQKEWMLLLDFFWSYAKEEVYQELYSAINKQIESSLLPFEEKVNTHEKMIIDYPLIFSACKDICSPAKPSSPASNTKDKDGIDEKGSKKGKSNRVIGFTRKIPRDLDAEKDKQQEDSQTVDPFERTIATTLGAKKVDLTNRNLMFSGKNKENNINLSQSFSQLPMLEEPKTLKTTDSSQKSSLRRQLSNF